VHMIMCWRDKKNSLKISEWQLGISYTTGGNHLIMRCSFVHVEICLEQIHISFNVCLAQKIMKNFTVLTHFRPRGLKL